MMLKEYGQRFAMVELDQPLLGPDDVPAKVEACGICGTDVRSETGSLRPHCGSAPCTGTRSRWESC
jgi:D-arabinose 1-dehydrogenase-like Zn-dependent alcohol dehydrogenase